MKSSIALKGAANLIVKRFAGPFWYRRRWLNKTQWLDRDQLEALQVSLLNKLLRHCYQTVPYYHTLMDDLKISVERNLPLDIVKKFPILTKADILSAGDNLISRKYPRWSLHTSHTGGSTGARLPLRRDFVSMGNEHAFVRRQFDWAGLDFSTRCAYLTWRSVAAPNESAEKAYAYDPFMKELILSTFHLSAATMDSYLEAMTAYGVGALAGYPSAIYEVAKYLKTQMRTFPLRAVLTSSETLGTEQRRLIQESFESAVYDYYGSAERVCYIHTCEKGHYHILPEYGLTELIPCDEPNEDCCRIVSTGFWNYAMPLVRYDMGDLVRPGEGGCSCGRAFPVVDSIVGRASQTVQTRSGRIIGLTAMGRLLKNVLFRTCRLAIEDSRFVLGENGEIGFEIIPKQGFDKKDEQQLTVVFHEELPDDLNVSIRQVSCFNRSVSGKIISLVQA